MGYATRLRLTRLWLGLLQGVHIRATWAALGLYKNFEFFFCRLSVALVPLRLQMEGNRPKGIAVALMAPVDLAVISLGALS